MTDAKTTSNGSNSGNGNGLIPTVKVPLPEWAEGLIDLALERRFDLLCLARHAGTLFV